MKSKLQKIGKDEVKRRVKIKRKIKRKKRVKSFLAKSLLLSSLLANVYYLSLPYHLQILTNITEIYKQVAPILESLLTKLPL